MMESLKNGACNAQMKAASADIEKMTEVANNQLNQDVYTIRTYAHYANCLNQIELR